MLFWYLRHKLHDLELEKIEEKKLLYQKAAKQIGKKIWNTCFSNEPNIYINREKMTTKYCMQKPIFYEYLNQMCVNVNVNRCYAQFAVVFKYSKSNWSSTRLAHQRCCWKKKTQRIFHGEFTKSLSVFHQRKLSSFQLSAEFS